MIEISRHPGEQPYTLNRRSPTGPELNGVVPSHQNRAQINVATTNPPIAVATSQSQVVADRRRLRRFRPPLKDPMCRRRYPRAGPNETRRGE